MTITLSSWVIPLLITIIVFWWAVAEPAQSGLDITPVLKLGGAMIVSLVAWLIWSLFN